MEKILVYDCSLFGQRLSNYLEQELAVKTERIVDSARLQDMSDREICQHVIEKIRPFIGKVAGIVIGSPLVVTVVAGELEKVFPKQKFIYLGREILGEIKATDKVAVFVLDRVRRTERYQVLKAACQEAWVNEYNYQEWLGWLDEGWWGREKVVNEFRNKLGMKVVLYHQAMLVREQKLEEVVDWRGQLIDMKKEMILPIKRAIRAAKNGVRV